jgi:6-phosphogluconolactonase/glucosamine-6-phosphate isomerase/deaminase
MEIKNFKVEKLEVSVHSDRPSMGQAAAKAAAERINAVIAAKGEANVVFAAAPSQNETLEYLLKEQAPQIMHRENEQVFKGFMMAYYAISDLQKTTQIEE